MIFEKQPLSKLRKLVKSYALNARVKICRKVTVLVVPRLVPLAVHLLVAAAVLVVIRGRGVVSFTCPRSSIG